MKNQICTGGTHFEGAMANPIVQSQTSTNARCGQRSGKHPLSLCVCVCAQGILEGQHRNLIVSHTVARKNTPVPLLPNVPDDIDEPTTLMLASVLRLPGDQLVPPIGDIASFWQKARNRQILACPGRQVVPYNHREGIVLTQVGHSFWAWRHSWHLGSCGHPRAANISAVRILPCKTSQAKILHLGSA